MRHRSIDVFCVCFLSVVVLTILAVDLDQLINGLMGPVQLDLQLFHQIFVPFTDPHVLLVQLLPSLGLLDLADVEDIIDRIYDLANFLRVLILLIDLILKILLQDRILRRNPFELTLNILHLPLLIIQGILQFIELVLLSGPCFLHLFVDLLLL